MFLDTLYIINILWKNLIVGVIVVVVITVLTGMIHH